MYFIQISVHKYDALPQWLKDKSYNKIKHYPYIYTILINPAEFTLLCILYDIPTTRYGVFVESLGAYVGPVVQRNVLHTST